MRKRNIYMKAMTMAVTTAMIAGVCPISVFAVTGSQVAADDIYTKTAHVARTQEDDDNEDIWDEYDVEVSVTVADGVFSDITVSPTTGYSADNATYFNKAYTGRNGVKLKLEGKAATEDTVNTWDAVSGATRTSSAIKTAVLEAVNGAEEAAGEVPDPQIDTAALEAEIAKVPLLVETDYTADSWSNLQTKLQAANEALAAKESQEAVNAAATALSDAITGLTPVEDDKEEENISYILMNIPYDKFYAADVNNSIGVDAFTSATLNKTRTGSLSGGSYHVNSDGTDITGITFPVKVSEGADLTGYTRITDANSVDIEVTNRGTTTTTTYQGKDALYESASYSYYVLSEAPSYYKEMTVGADGSLSFGAVQGTKTTLSDVTADLVTTTTYGDYQLSLDGLPIGGNDPIYGVIIGTKEGASYGLRHLENIWLGSELAWSTGFTTAVHNCPTSSEHYKAMMGQTINKITYYTKDGIYEIPADVYVPVKFSSEVKVEDAALANGETAITLTGIPSDFDAEYTAAGLNNVEVKDGKLSFEGTNVGSYTLNITDKSGKYAPISATFELTTDKVPVEYDEENKTLAVKDGFAESDLGAYVKNIQKVSVNGKEYAASGRGAVKIIDADGSLLTDAAPFAEAKSGDEFDIVVFATGYSVDYSFTYKIEDEIKEDDKKDPADSGEKQEGK
ncbi:MAG: FMN-binding protein [Clostridia bacterium]|nr:FMN-binding protein [Clostridia bacterium]